MTTKQQEQIFATDIKKSQGYGSDLERISVFMYSGAFTTCFLYDSRGNMTGLNTDDTFINGRPNTLLQLFLIDLISEINFDFERANINDTETQARLLNILHTVKILK